MVLCLWRSDCTATRLTAVQGGGVPLWGRLVYSLQHAPHSDASCRHSTVWALSTLLGRDWGACLQYVHAWHADEGECMPISCQP